MLAHAPERGREGGNLDEGERGLKAEESGTACLRLDPFGGGVLRVDTASGQARPVLPDDAMPPKAVAGDGGRLLFFHADGALAGLVLPAEAVWAICPATAELRSDVPLRTVVTSTLPLSWRGWRLVQLDLREASWLALHDPDAHPGTKTDGERRVVRGRTKPVLRTGLPVPGVTTTAGKPVFAGLPEVLLPPGQDRWRIEARRARSGDVVAGVTAAGDDWRPDALGRNVPRPLLGEFTVTVTPGLRRTVALAERVSVTSYPAPRLMSARGLEPAEAVISAPPGMTVSPAAVDYQEETVTRQVTCVAGPVVQHLAVTPPHIRLRVEPEPGSGGTATPWHHAGPLRLTGDDLWSTPRGCVSCGARGTTMIRLFESGTKPPPPSSRPRCTRRCPRRGVRWAAGRRSEAARVQRQQEGRRVLRPLPGVKPRARAAAQARLHAGFALVGTRRRRSGLPCRGESVPPAHRAIPYYDGYPNNNRPVQPLNDRIISARYGP